MKKIIFALTIVLSLISCTTEVTKEVVKEVVKEVNTEPKRVYTVKYNSSEEGTPNDFMCEEGYVLTEKELPDLNEKQYHTTIWRNSNGTEITKGYKVTSDIVLKPYFELDTQHYRYFLRAGDFYLNDKGIECSRPNGELISSVKLDLTSEYINDKYGIINGSIHTEIGGQTTLLLCDYFIGSRDFRDPAGVYTYFGSLIDRPSFGCDVRDVDVIYGNLKKQGFNQYSIIEEHSLYTNLDIDFSHTYKLCTLRCSGNSGDPYFLLLIDLDTKEWYEIYVHPDGYLYGIKPVKELLHMVEILNEEYSEEWTGDWSKKDNTNAPKIYKVKFNDIIIKAGSCVFLNFDYMEDVLKFGPCPIGVNHTFDTVDTDVYLELWHFD